MSGYRLKSGGTRIERSKPVRFTFDGKAVEGFDGDSVASALLASGRKTLARSFKYHRRRGVFSAGVEEPSALVTLHDGGRREPNVKAPTAEIYSGLQVRSQNAWPGLGFDLLAVNGALSPLLVAGFYYKTFFEFGQVGWHLAERFIRRAAGLGKAGFEPDPDRYERHHHFVDVLIIGGGVAGLSAALAAAETGKSVLLAEEDCTFGGDDRETGARIDGLAVAQWCAQAVMQLRAMDRVTLVPRLAIYGYFDGNMLAGVERVGDHLAELSLGQPRQRHWKIRAGEVAIATGSIERPMVFAGNDLPGVMLSNAAVKYGQRYGVAVGKRIVIFTNNDAGLSDALALHALGITVVAVVDARVGGDAGLVGELGAAGLEYRAGQVVTKAFGRGGVRAVSVADYAADCDNALRGAEVRITCDIVGVAGGFTPNVQLCSQAGGPPIYDAEIASFVPGEPLQNWRVCGAARGAFSLNDCLTGDYRVEERLKSYDILPLWEVPDGQHHGKKFVDLQHDVSAADVRLAAREGFDSVEHLKRYTTLGMAADQGKTSNINGLAILAEARGVDIGQVGTTRFRPPYVPVALGTIAGRAVGHHFLPTRRTPLESWHVEHGAVMMDAGLWRRPRYYPIGDESLQQAYIRETRTVRQAAGIVDVSTLGKIDVKGPDAAEFLNRIYANGFLKLPVGRARYGVMLREDGFVFDDGTVWRLADQHYLMTTTTANAGPVLALLERYLSVDWPELKVCVTSVSDQWGAMAVAGPKARDVLRGCVTGLDIGNEAFAFMAVGAGEIAGHSVWIGRVSFSGEVAYEIFAASHAARAVWEAIIAAGEPHGLIPYGIEALGALRIEKGHVAGPELDGRTTLDDLGLGRMASTKKPFVGSVLMHRPGLVRADRMQLVGLISCADTPLQTGAHLIENGQSIGHISSVTFSPALEKHIALGMVRDGRARHGDRLVADFALDKTSQMVELVSPHFYDPDGEKLHG